MVYSYVTLCCLFLVNGLGLGNSTRCDAVMQHLARAGCRIDVLTSGNGLNYFQDKPFINSVHAMEALFYAQTRGSISGWATLKSAGALAKLAAAKRRALTRLLENLRPDVAVIDSEYSISPLRRLGIPIVAINNSEAVVSEYLKRRRQAKGLASHFWFIEFSDYLFHRHYCDLVLSPFPIRTPTRHHKFRRIGLIVRPAIKALVTAGVSAEELKPRQLRKVVFMLSGSAHASEVHFRTEPYPFAIEVVGREGKSQGNVTFHGRLMDNSSVLAKADAFVINAGYSAVSECFALRKPTFVVPLPGHAEQYVNAALAADLGLGWAVREEEVLPRLLEMHDRNCWSGRQPMPAAFEINGAFEAAEAILSCAAKARARSASLRPALPLRLSAKVHSGPPTH